MAIVDVTGIGKSYRLSAGHKETVLQDVSLNIESGSVVGLLGPNGAGKTTLIKILSGLLRPDTGGGTILGYDLLRDHALIRSRISLVSPTSDVGTDNNLTVRQNLQFWAPVYGLIGERAKSRIEELLTKVNLRDKADAWPMHLSAGQRQRLALARSLLAENPLIFLDEPTNKLDFDGVRSVRELVQDLNRNHGVTILLTTHVMEEAEELCDAIALLREGKLLAYMKTRDLTQSLGLTRTIRVAFRRPWSAEIDAQRAGLQSDLARMPAVQAARVYEDSSTMVSAELQTLDIRATTPVLLDCLRRRNWNLISMQSEMVTLHDVFLSTIKPAEDMERGI